MIHPMIIAEVIKKIRKDRDLTQRELGQLLGVDKNSVWLWEQGENFPSDDLLPKISILCQHSSDELQFMKRAIRLSEDGIDLRSFVEFLTKIAA